jgi:putative endonuclease
MGIFYMEKQYYMYIMTNQWITVFYTGVTSDLMYRVNQHKRRLVKGFTSQYHINMLVYYEEFDNAYDAIRREKQIKNWQRKWKMNLIRKNNPTFKDLSEEWYDNNDEEDDGDVGDDGDPETSSG